MRICSVPGCGRKHKAHGYCETHRSQLKRWGFVDSKQTDRIKKKLNRYEVGEHSVKVYAIDARTRCESFFLIDKEDLPIVNELYFKIDKEGYVVCKGGEKMLHKILLQSSRDGFVVDHINRNTLDNRRSNLRYATFAQSSYNTGMKKNNTSGFKNVSKAGSRWLAYIGFEGKFIRIGRFKDKVDAAMAYDAVARELHGEFAVTNKSLGLL